MRDLKVTTLEVEFHGNRPKTPVRIVEREGYRTAIEVCSKKDALGNDVWTSFSCDHDSHQLITALVELVKHQ